MNRPAPIEAAPPAPLSGPRMPLATAGALPTRPRGRSRTRTRMMVIVNLRASGASSRRAHEVLSALGAGYALEAVETDEPGQAETIGAEAARAGYDIVAAFGGDGTTNAVANGIAGTRAAMACIPAGRTNVFARGLGIPNDPVAAAAGLLARAERPPTRRVDLGTMDGRHFVFGSGLGPTAAANRGLDNSPLITGRLTPYYVTYKALAALARYVRRPPWLRVTVGERSVDAVAVVVQNTDPLSYFGRRPLRVCEDAGLTAGTLSLAALTRASPLELVSVPARVLSGRASTVTAHPHIAAFSAVAEARVEALGDEGAPVEIDGEYVGDRAAVTYRVAPAAIRVVVP